MKQFDDETRVERTGPETFSGVVHPGWNIGSNPNGGYLVSLLARAMAACVPAHPDPLSLTVHYLQPGVPGEPFEARCSVLRSGRNVSTVRSALWQQGQPRLEVIAAMGVVSALDSKATISAPAPAIATASQCPSRSGFGQGVALPLLERLDIRIDPAPPAAPQARVGGWIRFRDGRQPDPLALLLFADAFPPAVFGLLGAVGWVPTVELTVHVRRRPSSGWVLGAFQSTDLLDGRVIEDGMLWDEQGHLVAQSRQLALVRTPGGDRRP